MKYYLTSNQFRNLDLSTDLPLISFFQQYWPQLKYLEHPSPSMPGFWGIVEGEEKYVTMFLLSIPNDYI